jgi:hypothetical protein
MSLRTQWLAGVLRWFDSTTDETVATLASAQYKEEFLQGSLDTAYWVARDTGAATEDMVGGAPSGIFRLALTSANEAQLAGIDYGNRRCWQLNQGLVFEARVCLNVLPTGAVVAVIGLCGDHNAAVNTVAESVWFRLDGSGAVTVENDDTVHETSQVATGVTVVANQWVTLRIECENPAAIRFYINGARVASGTTFNMSSGAQNLQPVMRIGKESAATTVGTLDIDVVRLWQARS